LKLSIVIPMIHLKIPPELVVKAKKVAKANIVLNKSYSQGRGNVVGVLGELLVNEKYNGTHAPTYSYDIIIHGTTVDVKTQTYNYDGPPPIHYTCSIPYWKGLAEHADVYCFVVIKRDLSEGWILGFCGADKFWKTCKVIEKGVIDERGYPCPESLCKLQYSDLMGVVDWEKEE
jgi:hypothetical protein